MLRNRVIPIILIDGNRCFKTYKFKSKKYIGDPINIIKIFNEKEVDEIIVLDINSSKYNQEPNYKLIEEMASECFMPMSYGGGIKNIYQAKRLFSLGIEKLSLQNAYLQNMNFISELSNEFGSQSIICSIDIKKNFFGKYRMYDSCNQKIKIVQIKKYIKQIENAGAGELLLNAVDRDGTLRGQDLTLIREISSFISIPLISAGGISSLSDIKNSINYGADAVAAGAFFCFYGVHKAVLISYPKYKKLQKILGEK